LLRSWVHGGEGAEKETVFGSKGRAIKRELVHRATKEGDVRGVWRHPQKKKGDL